MTPESPFVAADRLFQGVQKVLRPGGDFQLGPTGVTVAHYSVNDTALAACLLTMGIPHRNSAPFTDDVGLDTGGNETGRRKVWWVGECDPTGTHKTEEIAAAWHNRAAFEAANPLHPLNIMREAIDARTWWIDVLQAWKSHRAIFPIETNDPAPYITDSLHGAAVLKASGFRPLAFNRRGFYLEAAHTHLPAESLLLEAAQAEGATPPMWMARVLKNLSAMLKHVRAGEPILRQQFEGNTTLLLSAEATPRTRDRFLKLT